MKSLNWEIHYHLDTDTIQGMQAEDVVKVGGDFFKLHLKFVIGRCSVDDTSERFNKIEMTTIYPHSHTYKGEIVSSFEEGQKRAEKYREEFWNSLVNEIYKVTGATPNSKDI